MSVCFDFYSASSMFLGAWENVQALTRRQSQIIITQPDQDSDSGSSTDDEDLVAQHGIENDHIELPITHATGGSFSEYFDYDQAKASDDSDRVTVCSPPPAPVTSVSEIYTTSLNTR